jgi:ABC-type phosphate/phosphonate transport system substrate-binding protein
MRPGSAGAYLVATWLFATPLSAAPGALLVHLPSVPLESSTQLATAVTALRDYMSAEVPDFAIEVKIFRRWEDADLFYRQDSSAVVAVLSEASFLLDLPADEGFVPVWRFSRAGSETYHQVLVVRTEGQKFKAIGDLRDGSLQFVKTTGGQTFAFLSRAVFGGEVSPQDWFGSLEAVPDDFSAVANVLHGKIDAALVADYNPLLRSQLGNKLQALFTSPPLSLPVIALRSKALGPEQRAALDRAFSGMRENAEGKKVLEELGLDGLRPIADGGGRFDREALLRIPSVQSKTMEIALPSSPPAASAGSSELSPKDVTFSLALELPEIAPATELSSVHKTPR